MSPYLKLLVLKKLIQHRTLNSTCQIAGAQGKFIIINNNSKNPAK